jgi:hypothetical protein
MHKTDHMIVSRRTILKGLFSSDEFAVDEVEELFHVVFRESL